jgi:steroid delta-isomerase-like uncharacterized protein
MRFSERLGGGGRNMDANVLENAKVALETRDAERIVACYADAFVFEDIASNERITDRGELAQYFERLFSLPGVSFSDVVLLGGDGWAALEWTWSGARRNSEGEYRVRGASIIELRDGRIARETIYYDPRPAIS